MYIEPLNTEQGLEAGHLVESAVQRIQQADALLEQYLVGNLPQPLGAPGTLTLIEHLRASAAVLANAATSLPLIVFAENQDDYDPEHDGDRPAPTPQPPTDPAEMTLEERAARQA